MIKVELSGKNVQELEFKKSNKRVKEISQMIKNRTGLGNDFLGWTDYVSKLDSSVVTDLINTSKKIRKEAKILVVIGIGGSYLGARAAIEAVQGLYPQRKRGQMEIIYLGNTLSSNYTYQVLDYLKGKKFAINVISKSGTTTEPAIAFRLCKELLISQVGEEKAKELIVATTDRERGALKTEANSEGYHTFVIPDDVGGRYSVITPVGLFPMACAGLDIKKFLKGVKDGEKQYSSDSFEKNEAYKYGLIRYLFHTQLNIPSEMYISYEPQMNMINEWLKQLFGESEGKEGKALLPTSAVFTTDLHSMGQFIQEGSEVIFETILKPNNTTYDITLGSDSKDLDGLNYLAGKNLSYVNDKAYEGTLEAHTSGHINAVIINFDELNEYSIGNLMYFFMRACAMSAYLLEINPFNQPGVEIYKKNMFKLLGKPSK